MELTHGLHLASRTGLPVADAWVEMRDAISHHSVRLKDWVAPAEPYAIGIHLTGRASEEILCDDHLPAFRDWLVENGCYVFSISAYAPGPAHGRPDNTALFRPDWSSPRRLEATRNQFTALAELMSNLPVEEIGTVSTLPATFKALTPDDEKLEVINDNLITIVRYLRNLEDKTGRRFLLGLEPEPLGWFETTLETIAFFHELREHAAPEDREALDRYLGVTYNTCHLAMQFESAAESLLLLREAGISITKYVLGNALSLNVDPDSLDRVRDLSTDTGIHQVVGHDRETGELYRYLDLPDALNDAESGAVAEGDEWRIHFHVPLQCLDADGFGTTGLHITGALDQIEECPDTCPHLEIETFTWDVLPEHLREGDPAHQLAYEYAWTLAQLNARGIGPRSEAA